MNRLPLVPKLVPLDLSRSVCDLVHVIYANRRWHTTPIFFLVILGCSFMFTDDADRPRASINRPVPLLASWLVGWLVLMRQVHRISPLPTNPQLTELVLFSERSPFAIHLPRYSRGQRFESRLLPRQSDGPSVDWAKKKKK